MEEKKTYFTAKNLALTGIFAALAFGVSLLEFPIFPAALFFKLDFSFAVILLSAYMLGALGGEIVALISIGLHLLVSSSSVVGVGVGELANFIMAQVFAILPAIAYHYKRNFKTVIITLCIAIIVNCGIALLCNRYLLFPMYFPEGAAERFKDLWLVVLFFNFVKGLLNAIITILLYKRLKNLLNKIF